MLEGFVPWPADLGARYRRDGIWEAITVVEMIERDHDELRHAIPRSRYKERTARPGPWRRLAA